MENNYSKLTIKLEYDANDPSGMLHIRADGNFGRNTVQTYQRSLVGEEIIPDPRIIMIEDLEEEGDVEEAAWSSPRRENISTPRPGPSHLNLSEETEFRRETHEIPESPNTPETPEATGALPIQGVAAAAEAEAATNAVEDDVCIQDLCVRGTFGMRVNHVRKWLPDGYIPVIRILKTKGLAFLRYHSKKDALKAMSHLNNNGHPCDWARTEQGRKRKRPEREESTMDSSELETTVNTESDIFPLARAEQESIVEEGNISIPFLTEDVRHSYSAVTRDELIQEVERLKRQNITKDKEIERLTRRNLLDSRITSRLREELKQIRQSNIQNSPGQSPRRAIVFAPTLLASFVDT